MSEPIRRTSMWEPRVNQIRVTVWNEYRHEREDERYRSVYPDGIHGAIAEGLRASD